MKTYDIYAIGNALVDYEFRVDDDALKNLGVDKGIMTLTSPDQMASLMGGLRTEDAHRSGGGSAANTVVALAQLGGKAFFSCRVTDDEAGTFFEEELRRFGVQAKTRSQNEDTQATGKCLVLVTPDAQRSMCTMLGISSLLDDSTVDADAIRASRYYYMEGYLSSSPSGLQAALAGKTVAKEHGVALAMTLSDVNMIRYCRAGLEAMLEGGVDLLFCNEAEAAEWSGSHQLDIQCDAMAGLATMVCMTRGARGVLLLYRGQRVEVPGVTVQAVDTNGAGDMFAGAYLWATTKGHAPAKAALLANRAAAQVVSQMGNRLEQDCMDTIKAEFLDAARH